MTSIVKMSLNAVGDRFGSLLREMTVRIPFSLQYEHNYRSIIRPVRLSLDADNFLLRFLKSVYQYLSTDAASLTS